MKQIKKIETSLHLPTFRYDIEAKINEIIDAIDTITDQVKSIRDGWTSVEIKKAEIKPWPQMGDDIYRLNSRGSIIHQYFNGSAKQLEIKAFAGLYRTQEEAELMRDAIRDLAGNYPRDDF